MRREFPRTVRVAVIKRATRHSVVYCEGCGDQAKRFQIDHVCADALGGAPTIDNAQLLCDGCFSVKNPDDARVIARANRREAAHLGANPAPSRPIKSAGFRKSQRVLDRATSTRLPPPPRRSLFEKAPLTLIQLIDASKQAALLQDVDLDAYERDCAREGEADVIIVTAIRYERARRTAFPIRQDGPADSAGMLPMQMRPGASIREIGVPDYE